MAFSFGKKPEAGGEYGGTNVPVSQVLNMKGHGMNNSQIANQLRNQGFSLTQIKDALTQADIKSAVGGDMNSGMQMPYPENAMMGNYPGNAAPGNYPGNANASGNPMPDLGPMPELGPMPDFGQMPEVGPMPDFGQMPEVGPMPENAPMPTMQQQQHQGGGMGIALNPEVLVNELQRILEEIIDEKWRTVEEKLNSLDVWKTKIEEKTNALSDNVTQLTKRIDDFAGVIASRTEGYSKTIQDVNIEMEAMEKMMGKLVPSLAEEIKELRSVVEKIKER